MYVSFEVRKWNINSVINLKTDIMKTIFKLLTGLFYLPLLAIAFIMAIILFILEMTVMFTYNQSIEWKQKMIISADAWVKKLK